MRVGSEPGRLFVAGDAVVVRKTLEAPRLRLDADEADALIGGGADGAAAFGRDAEPVARLELDHFAINVEFAPAFEDAVDLLVLNVPVRGADSSEILRKFSVMMIVLC